MKTVIKNISPNGVYVLPGNIYTSSIGRNLRQKYENQIGSVLLRTGSIEMLGFPNKQITTGSIEFIVLNKTLEKCSYRKPKVYIAARETVLSRIIRRII